MSDNELVKNAVLEMGVNPEKSFFIYAKQHCPRRSLEASKLYNYLIKNRLYPVDDLKQADYILITHPYFYQLSSEYLNFISNNYQVTTKLINVLDIYDQFNYGFFSPEPIREFLYQANQNSTSSTSNVFDS